MNVLSLFDGMSCGRLALERLGIKVDNYYAAEIDKYATQVSEANYPDIIRLGDVCGVKAENLPKIDLLLAGSPCQGFSFAGKQLAFDDPRSALFFEFVRILKECKPKYFLLENVKMKKEFLDIITQQVGVHPILINSALLSAQNRQRYYWTNIPRVEQPEQKGIVLKDILETGNISKEYKYSQKSIDYMNRGNEKWKTTKRADKYQQTADKEKSFTVTANWHKGIPYNFFQDDIKTLEKDSEEFDKNLDKMTNKEGKAYCLTARYDGATAWNSIEKKQKTMIPVAQETHEKPLKVGMNVEEVKIRAPTLTAMGGGNREPKVVVQSYREVRTEEAKRLRKESQQQTGKDHTPFRAKELIPREDGKVGTVTPGLNNEHLISLEKLPDTDKPNQINPSKKASGKQPHMQDRVFHVDGKSHSLTREFASRTNVGTHENVYWRKLTPVECERLQTVPDNYTNHVSKTQRYKMLGNGWTIDVIAHILKNMQILEEGGELPQTKGQQGFEF